MLEKFAELAMSFDNVIFDVVEKWGDDLMTIIGANAPDHNGARSITTFAYDNEHADGSDTYTLLENGEIFRVEIKTVDDGVTWNGDDVFTEAHKNIITYKDKIGQIEIDDLDYFIDENIEFVACNLIECLRENVK